MHPPIMDKHHQNVEISTELDTSTNVHLHDDTRIILKKCGGGLYYFDTTNEDFYQDQTTYYTFINSLESNKSFFQRQETKGAGEARILHKLVGWQSTQTLKEAVKNNQPGTFQLSQRTSA